MNLYHLGELLNNTPAFKDLLNTLQNKDLCRVSLCLAEQAQCYLAAAVFDILKRPVLFITAHSETAGRRFDQLRLWLKPGDELFLFPDKERASGLITESPAINAERMKILFMLAQSEQRKQYKIPSFIVASALSLAGRHVRREELLVNSINISQGKQLRQSDLLSDLNKAGYQYEDVVEIPGTFGKRGGIIDIFPTGIDQPVRIEFFGDVIESIREYDAKTQRSIKLIRGLTIAPAADNTGGSTACILDYLTQDTIVFADEIAQIEAELEKIEKEEAALCDDEEKAGIKHITHNYFSLQEIKSKIGTRRCFINLSAWNELHDSSQTEIKLQLRPASNYAGRFPVFIEGLPQLRREKKRILIVSQQSDRVRELLREYNIEVFPVAEMENIPVEYSLTLVQGFLDGGFQLDDKLLILTDSELFGTVKQRRPLKSRPVRHHWFLNDINTGDLVVHIEHGIGRFAGTTRKMMAGIEKEYLILEYAGGDTLYVPVEQVDRVSLYIGGGERTPALHRLGTQEWNRTRQKVKESVENIAGELIELYAKREAGEGIAFPRDTLWQKELEAAFPYMETLDQLEAVNSVKQDMESARPMDRLICGDVGYGKTEIAVRAAFKAVMNGKQVAVLVPTTILTQQHINTFSERLNTYPVKIASLSRFASAKEQNTVIANLKEGNIDICIGTHRILQKDVQFKDLGLVIIDEEQRFGVAHKDHFKKMRQSVDVLTLSATPIPRTMHMALSGIRDMSTIETPPENRLPINTYVGEFSNHVIREAILREIEREGQVFIVHNRVHSIGALSCRLKEIVPEASIAVAHGQMNEEQLERIMTDFIEGKNDVLVTTTIIESGLDMPNVNTLIVDSADKLGLTQLYQLRGRVGRGSNAAYAYFLFDSGKRLTEHARERLKTIAQATELGAGFAIAMKDLEIRGAGNLLGVEQSGNIASVGFNYYCQLLAEAVEQIKARRLGEASEKKTEFPSVSVDIKLTAYIAQDYIENTRTRFNIYQRLARCTKLKGLVEIEEELNDRFGEAPVETQNLLFIVKIKVLALQAGIEAVSNDDGQIILAFRDGVFPDSNTITLPMKKSVYFGNRQIRIDLDKTGGNWRALLTELLERITDAGTRN